MWLPTDDQKNRKELTIKPHYFILYDASKEFGGIYDTRPVCKNDSLTLGGPDLMLMGTPEAVLEVKDVEDMLLTHSHFKDG